MMSANQESASAKKLKARMVPREREISILIVDDDPDFLNLVFEQVGQIENVHIECAVSCEEAVERLTSRRFQLVICDWALATRTGPEVFSLADPLLLTAREPLHKIPVMFMSGSEKMASTQSLRSFKHFEPVTFMIKNLGAKMIRVMAENVLMRFNHLPERRCQHVYLS